MAVTATSFKTEYPFFSGVSDADVNLALAQAEDRIYRASFSSDDLADRATMLLIAHILANDPRSRPTLLTQESKKGGKGWSTLFWDEYKRLLDEQIIGVTCG